MSEEIRNSKYIEFILVIISLIILTIITLCRKQNAEQIKNDYQVSIGHIVKYHPTDPSDQGSIKYCYVADDSVLYYRTIYVTYKFENENCHNFEKCKDKQYWVIYSTSNPKNSLINLNLEIQGIENPEFPQKLDDFE